MKHAPYGPPVGFLFASSHLRSFPVCASIFPFFLRMGWVNLNLTGKMTLGCFWLLLAPTFFLATLWLSPLSLRLLILRLFCIILLYFGSLWPL